MKRTLSILIALSFQVILYAQSELSAPLAREASIAAVRILDSYDNYCRVTEVTEEEFKNLFHNTELEIYNDLTGLSANPYIPVSEYAELLLSKVKSCKTIIGDVQKQRVFLRGDGAVVVPVTMWKSIEYTDRRDVFFSSTEIFNADHIITMEIVYYPSDKKAFIESISGTIDARYAFPEPYEVVPASGNVKADSLVRYKDTDGKYKPLKFNSRKQAFVPAGTSGDDWHSWDLSNISVLLDRQSNGLVNFKMKHWNGRFEPYGAISLYSPMKLSCNDEKVKNSSASYEGGFNFGVMITSQTQTHFGIFTGLGYSCIKFNFERQISENFVTADDTGTPVTLNNTADLSQNITTQWFYLPAFFRLEFLSNCRVKPQFDFGLRFYVNPSWLLNNTDVFYSGFSTIHATGTFNDEPYDTDIFHQTTSNDLTVAKWYLSGFASLGVDVSITKRLGAFLNLSYELSFLSNLTDNEIVRNNVAGDVENPVEYMFSTGSFQAYGPLSPTFTATKRALMLKLGLSLKF